MNDFNFYVDEISHIMKWENGKSPFDDSIATTDLADALSEGRLDPATFVKGLQEKMKLAQEKEANLTPAEKEQKLQEQLQKLKINNEVDKQKLKVTEQAQMIGKMFQKRQFI